MAQLTLYLNRIATLSLKIRSMQIQNGYSAQQINKYLTQLLQLNLQTNPNIDILKLPIITPTIQTLQQIISCLQVQIYNLTCTNMEKFIDQSITSTQIDKQQINTVQKQLKISHYQNNLQFQSFSTQKQFNTHYSSTKKQLKANLQAYSQQLYQRQIETKQTLEKIKKLRKYLNVKIRQNKAKSFQILNKVQEMIVD